MAIVVNGDPSPESLESLPPLYVVTHDLDGTVDLLSRVPESPSAMWLHGRGGMVAIGATVRVSASGPERFAHLSAHFDALTARARVDDPVLVRGSGLTAFVSVSYSDDSPRPSRFVIPELILGRSGGTAFLTRISTEPLPALADDEVAPLLARFSGRSRTRLPDFDLVPGHSPASYQSLVQRAFGHITNGEAHKVVLSERFTVDLPGVSAPSLVPDIAVNLARRYTGAWTYALDDIVGASPEMLVRTDGSRLFSRVLAGSRPVADGGSLADEDRTAFLADPKERAEHAYAVDSVTEPLANLTTSLTASPEPFVLRLPGLEHLASDVTGVLRGSTGIVDVAERLHPSAAVSGTPREAADALIRELERTDRGGYAAPVGWLGGNGDGELAIALRMAHVGQDSLILQAGGGLVAQSDPLTEHAEVLAKTRPVVRALEDLRPL